MKQVVAVQTASGPIPPHRQSGFQHGRPLPHRPATGQSIEVSLPSCVAFVPIK
ncbi:MAG TPA: hypothetical protein VMP11_20835 [Verrucomicrobiae bacterium]|nr:hypothetical protein [Verrucomicrobiae bacterium]